MSQLLHSFAHCILFAYRFWSFITCIVTIGTSCVHILRGGESARAASSTIYIAKGRNARDQRWLLPLVENSACQEYENYVNRECANWTARVLSPSENASPRRVARRRDADDARRLDVSDYLAVDLLYRREKKKLLSNRLYFYISVCI